MRKNVLALSIIFTVIIIIVLNLLLNAIDQGNWIAGIFAGAIIAAILLAGIFFIIRFKKTL